MKLFLSLSLLLGLALPSFAQTSTDINQNGVYWPFLLEETGDVLQIALPASGALISILKKDYEGTKKLAFSYGTTLAITYALKGIIDKQRPGGRNRFDSFPSGHTSSAFSGASFIQRRYGWGYGAPAYLLAGLVGLSRVKGINHYHDGWDVLAGAIIGIGSTYIFCKPHEDPRFELNLASIGRSTRFSFRYRF